MEQLEYSSISSYDTRLDVTFFDCDVFGQAAYTSYIQWQNKALDSFLYTNPIFRNYISSKALLPKTIIGSIDYKRPTKAWDQIVIKTTVSEITSDYCDFLCLFQRNEAEMVCSGQQRIVLSEIKTGRPLTFPSVLKDEMKKFFLPDSVSRLNFSVIGNHVSPKVFIYDEIIAFFGHTDVSGKVDLYHYFNWAGYTREAYFQKTVPNFREVARRPIKMMTVNMDFKILDDAEFGDRIEARLTTAKIKRSSFEMIIRYHRKSDDRLLCYGKHRVVFVNAQTGKCVSIPEEMMNVIVHYEEKSILAH
ncbi:MAG: thioesterase family protein [Candidatus Omnitrophica bacterium]|nr:thioesterase family protein [Candidatus Omnitrophota bacterium]